MAKRYTAAHVRARLSEALDEAERGHSVLIERRGVTYEQRRAPAARTRPRRRSALFEVLDPAVAGGLWSWAWTPGRVTFTGGGGKRR